MSENIAVLKERIIKESAPKYVTIEAYFKAEEKSLTKNEYHDGIVTAMAGAKLRHNLLAQKAAYLIQNFIEEKLFDFKVSNSDTKIRIEDFNKIVYLDAAVICETPQYFNDFYSIYDWLSITYE